MSAVLSEQPRTYDAKALFVLRRKAQRDFYFFCRWMMLRRYRRKWMRGPHHKIVCDALMKAFNGELKRLIINIPPRYSKTQLVQFFIAWTLGHCPDSEYLYISFGTTLAADKTAEIRDLVQDPEYRAIFPDVVLTKEGLAHWKTTQGGVVYAAGSDATITGLGAGKMRPGWGGALVYDDPHKPEEVRIEHNREAVKRIFRNTIESRLNLGNTPIILIMQALHEEDLSQWLLGGGNGEKWAHVCVPALLDEGTTNERPLWPEKHSLEDLHRIRSTKPYDFYGQYQQRPVPPGGGFFQEKDLLVNECAVDWPQKIDAVFAIIDSAMKTGQTHDGLAVTFFGLDKKGMQSWPLTVLDWDLKQIAGGFLINWLPKVFARLEELSRLTKARMGSQGVWIEDKVSGTILIQQATNLGYDVHAIDSKLTAMGKAERAIDVEGHVHEGKVKITRHAYDKTVEYKGVTRNHWLAQVLRFSPEAGDKDPDDALDTFTYGIAISLGNAGGF